MQRHGVVYQSHQFGRDLCHAGRRFHQAGIARTQSRHGKTHDLPHRVIPRHHRQHHAQRLKAHLRQTRLGGDGFAVEQFGRELGVIAYQVNGFVDFGFTFAQAAPHFHAHSSRQFRLVGFYALGQSQQLCGTVGDFVVGPCGL